jgi:hypothetical protein
LLQLLLQAVNLCFIRKETVKKQECIYLKEMFGATAAAAAAAADTTLQVHLQGPVH